MPDPFLDSLTGGIIPEGDRRARGHETFGRSIDSLLKALAGPHAQIAEDISQGRQPTLPQSIDALGLLPGPAIGGVRTPTGRSGPIQRNMSNKQLSMVNQIEEWLSNQGIRYQVEIPSSSNQSTAYIKFKDPHSKRPIDEQIIRVPSDGHMGYVSTHPQMQRANNSEFWLGNSFDTGHQFDTRFARGREPQPEYATNASGEPFSDLPTLFDALKWRNGLGLVSPGREPRISSKLKEGGTVLTYIPTQWGVRGIRDTPPPGAMGQPVRPRKVTLPPRQLELFRR